MARLSFIAMVIVAALMSAFKMSARHTLRSWKPLQTLFPWLLGEDDDDEPEEPIDANETEEELALRLLLKSRRLLKKKWIEDPQPTSHLFTDDDLCVSYMPIYLAIRGEVFNVSRGEGFYGKDGGYEDLARMDNSMGFTDLSLSASHNLNWTPSQVATIESWRKQYHADYIFAGRHVGAYYDEYGLERPEMMRSYQSNLKKNAYIQNLQQEHRKKYPGCNSRSSKEETQVYCSLKNGGKPLKDGSPDWVGYPRRIKRPHRDKLECACVKDPYKNDLGEIHLFKVASASGDAPAKYCGEKETVCIWNPEKTEQDE